MLWNTLYLEWAFINTHTLFMKAHPSLESDQNNSSLKPYLSSHSCPWNHVTQYHGSLNKLRIQLFASNPSSCESKIFANFTGIAG